MKQFLAQTVIVTVLAAALAAQAQPAARVASTGGKSPHETTSAVIEGNRVTVTYGRPFTKDPKTGEMRKIWGGLVPYGAAWRMGADEATTLITQKPIMIGFCVINVVASSAPIRHAAPYGTRPPQIFRISPVLGSLVNGRPYVTVTRFPSITALVVSCGLFPPVDATRAAGWACAASAAARTVTMTV